MSISINIFRKLKKQMESMERLNKMKTKIIDSQKRELKIKEKKIIKIANELYSDETYKKLEIIIKKYANEKTELESQLRIANRKIDNLSKELEYEKKLLKVRRPIAIDDDEYFSDGQRISDFSDSDSDSNTSDSVSSDSDSE